MSLREQVASSINGSLHRLPLILEILDEIHESKGPRRAGDDDLERGSIRAVDTIIRQIRKIEPVAIKEPTGFSSISEQITSEWLLGDRPHLLPPQLLEELVVLISQLLPGLPNDPHGSSRRCDTTSDSP